MDHSWPSDWLRGVLETMVLAVVTEGETYGYRVATRLAEAGMGTIKGGTLYPLLNRLERNGDVAALWRQGDGGPGRKYYSITPAGRERFARQSSLWQEFTERTSRLLEEGRGHDPG